MASGFQVHEFRGVCSPCLSSSVGITSNRTKLVAYLLLRLFHLALDVVHSLQSGGHQHGSVFFSLHTAFDIVNELDGELVPGTLIQLGVLLKNHGEKLIVLAVPDSEASPQKRLENLDADSFLRRLHVCQIYLVAGALIKSTHSSTS